MPRQAQGRRAVVTAGTARRPARPHAATRRRSPQARRRGAPAQPLPPLLHPPAGSRSLRQLPTATFLTVIVLVLCVLGLVMVGSASSVVSLTLYGSPWVIFSHEVLWMVVGLLVFAAAVRVPYQRYRTWCRPFLGATFLLTLVVLVPGVGVHTSGSSRWLGYGEFRIQPSELMKLALVLFAADLVVRRTEEGAGYRRLIGPLLLVTGAAAALVVLQPDMGTAMVLVCVALAVLFASGVPMGPVMKILAWTLAAGVVVGLVLPYRRARLLSFIDPSAHSATSGYQVLQSLIGLGAGHLFGLGLGDGRQKWGLLPNAHTDFIFSVVGEELGLAGTLTVLALLGLLAFLGLRAASRAPDLFGSLVAVGLVAFFAAETVINVGAVIGVLPVTGIPLPFISYGGSSLVITLASAGVLVNVSRYERRPAVAGRATRR
jgi:cell division protein FtsW